uniref:Uncharacterized protein n=1 Tax=Fagus sylvatica TaxID=28930 RepID=A0A2N9GHK0_FAGSY
MESGGWLMASEMGSGGDEEGEVFLKNLDGSDLLALVVSAAIATDKILKRGFDGGREIAKEAIDEDALHEICREP